MSEQRYLGTEVEYSVQSHTNGVTISDIAYRMLEQEFPTAFKPHNSDEQWHVGKAYVDTGDHPEYASPESVTAQGATQQELLGEAHIGRLFLKSLVSLEEDNEKPINAELSKKGSFDNIDHRTLATHGPSTVGQHENYMVPRSTFNFYNPHGLPSQEADSLAVHLITRQIFTGGGGFIAGNYFVSPRAQYVREYMGHATTMNRPIINTRDEPLASQQWRRIHVISGDENISPWALYMKLGTTKLVLKAIEEGLNLQYLLPLRPTRTFRLISSDTTLKRDYPLSCSGNSTALATQQRILELVKAHGVADTEEEQHILEQWHQALQALEAKDETPNNPTLRGIDWITRGVLIQRQKEKGKNQLQADYDYSRIVNNLGVVGTGLALRNKGYFPLTNRLLDTEVPLPARPLLRSHIAQLFKAHPDARREASLSWQKFSFKGRSITLPDFPTPEEISQISTHATQLLQ